MQKMFVWWQAAVILTHGRSSLTYLTFDLVMPKLSKLVSLNSILSDLDPREKKKKEYVAEAERLYRVWLGPGQRPQTNTPLKDDTF